MAIRFSDLEADQREIAVEFSGNEVKLTYRPSAYTPILEEKMMQSLESKRPYNGMAQVIADVVVEWDVLEDDGEMYPLEYEELRTLPSQFLMAVIEAITEDMSVSREELKNSDGGSQAKRSKRKTTSRRTGTFT